MKKLSDLKAACKDCAFWDGDDDPDEDGMKWGFCRYGPGFASLSDDGQIVTVIPVKREDEWCSLLKPRN